MTIPCLLGDDDRGALMFWRGVVGYLPMNIVQGVVGLFSIVVFTRWLSPADYGVYALAFSAMSLVHTLVFTWMEAAMARFYAPEAEGGRPGRSFRHPLPLLDRRGRRLRGRGGRRAAGAGRAADR